MMNLENKNKACREVLLIIDALPEIYRQKVPADVLRLFEEQQDLSYHPAWENTITADSNAGELDLLHETITMIAWLNLEFWEESEEKKKKLWEAYERNGRMEELKTSNPE